MKKEKPDPIRKDLMDIPNTAEMDFWFSAWIGAIFFYCINFGQKPFKELNDERFIKRNAIIGWLINMIFIFGGPYLVFIVMNSF